MDGQECRQNGAGLYEPFSCKAARLHHVGNGVESGSLVSSSLFVLPVASMSCWVTETGVSAVLVTAIPSSYLVPLDDTVIQKKNRNPVSIRHMSLSYLLIINISFAFYYFSSFVKIEIIVADYYVFK